MMMIEDAVMLAAGVGGVILLRNREIEKRLNRFLNAGIALTVLGGIVRLWLVG